MIYSHYLASESRLRCAQVASSPSRCAKADSAEESAAVFSCITSLESWERFKKWNQRFKSGCVKSVNGQLHGQYSLFTPSQSSEFLNAFCSTFPPDRAMAVTRTLVV